MSPTHPAQTLSPGPTPPARAPEPLRRAMATTDRPDYGLDSPKMLVAFGGLAVLFAVWAVVAGIGAPAAALGPAAVAAVCVGAAAFMVRSSRVVKPALWARTLDDLGLRGDERALDAGCGRGVVTVALAERLPRGSVVGADIWRPRDATGNTRANAERNLELAGVTDRVELVDASMIQLPFDDGEFDLVTASLSLHCLPIAKERGLAMHELMRVTRPGGRIVILDVGKTFEYQAWLNDAGWEDVVRGRASYGHYPPLRPVTARRPKKGGQPGSGRRQGKARR